MPKGSGGAVQGCWIGDTASLILQLSWIGGCVEVLSIVAQVGLIGSVSEPELMSAALTLVGAALDGS